MVAILKPYWSFKHEALPKVDDVINMCGKLNNNVFFSCWWTLIPDYNIAISYLDIFCIPETVNFDLWPEQSKSVLYLVTMDKFQ